MMQERHPDGVAVRLRVPGLRVAGIHTEVFPNRLGSGRALLGRSGVFENHVAILSEKREFGGSQSRFIFELCRKFIPSSRIPAGRGVDAVDSLRIDTAAISVEHPTFEFLEGLILAVEVTQGFMQSEAKAVDDGVIRYPGAWR